MKLTLKNVLLCKGFKENQSPPESIVTYVKIFIAEFVAMYYFIFLGCGCMSTKMLNPLNDFPPAFTYGLVFGFCIQISFHVNYCHLNPAFTLCYYFLGFITVQKVAIYWLAQMLGGVLGFLSVKNLSMQKSIASVATAFHIDQRLCTTEINPELGIMNAFLLEFMGTSLCSFCICGAVDPRNEHKLALYPIIMAMLQTVLVFVMIPYTGGSMNPARSFAPALVNGIWENHWVYWAGPMFGAGLTTIFYSLLYWPREEKHDDEIAEG